MNCLNCDYPVDGKQDICPHCGFDLRLQKKCYAISNMYYNQGLDRAQIRDLSGAIDMLLRSLKFNKYNVQARNLLGLVYFETGEAVAALSEWVISKNIMPEMNIASEYIARLQAEQERLDVINQSIKNYNEALLCCRKGNEDVASIQLRKIIAQNPKLIKAYHLLALIYIEKREFEKARKALKRVAKIDKTNSTTLRFLKEVDEQTGTQTNLEQRSFIPSRYTDGFLNPIPENLGSRQTVIQPPTFRESSTFTMFLNIAMGVAIGALLVWYLLAPAYKQKVNREAEERLLTYTTTMASQNKELDNLQVMINNLQESSATAREEAEASAAKETAYENLLKAVSAFQAENEEQAVNALTQVDSEVLSVEALAVYKKIYDSVQDTMFQKLVSEGQEAFDNANYTDALVKLEKAKTINGKDYTVLNLIAHSYRLSGETQKAVAAFQEIIDVFPGTRKAERAVESINSLGGSAVLTSSAADPGTEAKDGEESPTTEGSGEATEGTAETGEAATGANSETGENSEEGENQPAEGAAE